jgi:hypothetical protein
VAASVQTAIPPKVAIDAKLARKPGAGGSIVFGLILAAGLFYVATHLSRDLSVEKAITIRSFMMLAGALLIDLIVMVTHGRRGLARLVEGSIAEKVLCIAPCPVLALRME